MAAPTSPVDLPSRTQTNMSSFSEDAVPEADPSTVCAFFPCCSGLTKYIAGPWLGCADLVVRPPVS